MIILSLDSTQEDVSCALYDGCTRLAFGQWLLKKTERIPTCVASFLHGLSVKPSDIRRLAVVNGPGNYSSLRNGLIMVKTMSQYLNIPIVSYSKADVMCYRYRHLEQWVIPVIDVRQHMIYTGIGRYEAPLNGVHYLQAPAFLDQETWSKQWPELEGTVVCSSLLPDGMGQPGRFMLDMPYSYAGEAAEMALGVHEGLHWAELRPLYAREAVVQKTP